MKQMYSWVEVDRADYYGENGVVRLHNDADGRIASRLTWEQAVEIVGAAAA
jgi:hypothetical protein